MKEKGKEREKNFSVSFETIVAVPIPHGSLALSDRHRATPLT